MSKNTGGPAFPHHFTPDSVGDCEGMTLRDYFAAKAVSFLVPLRASHQSSWEELACSAYELADAMLEAREK